MTKFKIAAYMAMAFVIGGIVAKNQLTSPYLGTSPAYARASTTNPSIRITPLDYPNVAAVDQRISVGTSQTSLNAQLSSIETAVTNAERLIETQIASPKLDSDIEFYVSRNNQVVGPVNAKTLLGNIRSTTTELRAFMNGAMGL
jgi:hypothetical protein